MTEDHSRDCLAYRSVSMGKDDSGLLIQYGSRTRGFEFRWIGRRNDVDIEDEDLKIR